MVYCIQNVLIFIKMIPQGEKICSFYLFFHISFHGELDTSLSITVSTVVNYRMHNPEQKLNMGNHITNTSSRNTHAHQDDINTTQMPT